MKIVKFQGGLGNQMFQYALMLSLKKHFNELIFADITMFKNYTWHEFELERVFNIQLPLAKKNDLQKVTYYHSNYNVLRIIRKLFGRKSTEFVEKKGFSFDNTVFSVSNKKFYDGYWINNQYIENIKEELKKDFEFKNELSIQNQIIIKKMGETESVSIHVRRGNYLLLDAYKGICELDYYQSAINYIRKKKDNIDFYIFSNDIKWCQENLTNSFKNCNFSFVDWNLEENNYIDMQLMSMCKHNIIAHSTFSWWGAWFNENPDKIVVAPGKWINSEVLTPNLTKWVLF